MNLILNMQECHSLCPRGGEAFQRAQGVFSRVRKVRRVQFTPEKLIPGLFRAPSRLLVCCVQEE